MTAGEKVKQKKKECEIDGCHESARYPLYKTFLNGEKKWLWVCVKHEYEIGNENERDYTAKR